MFWKIAVKDKPGIFDSLGQGVLKDIRDLGIKNVRDVAFEQLYIIAGDLSDAQVKKICEQLLVDTVTQEYELNPHPHDTAQWHAIEVAYNPGVMDPVEESCRKAIADLGISGVTTIKTAKKYRIKGRLNPAQLKTISEKLLYNKLIQHIVKDGPSSAKVTGEAAYSFKLITVDLLSASQDKLKELSRQGQLFLSLQEMLHIQRYFTKLGRNPTDCELETIAQTWSEHCAHKTFRGKIDYREKILDAKPRALKIDNLLKSTIMKVTQELNKSWCVSVFQDNSGVIRFDEANNICFKVETHNHPSALEPFGGANTGIGGVIRDPLGTGMGARPICNTDIFCFAPPDYPFSRLPPGTLHPKRIMKGVVSGVRDYGNKMGIPTVNGSILFHEGFVGNPLVYCGTVGIMPKEKSFKEVKAGDKVVVVGGKTGRDGIHGATFSSGELTRKSETESCGAVQIGNPIQEKKMVEAVIAARDMNLYHAITDCGAGGLSSAVGEMAEALGAKVWLDKVPKKYLGLSYDEIWISESQERMVLAVPKEKVNALIRVFNQEDCEATSIGEFTNSGKLELFYTGQKVCELGMDFLHRGLPQIEKKAVFIRTKHAEPKINCPPDLTPTLLKLLSHYDTCSKEWVIRQYDHEVQGGSVLKPLAGEKNDGPSDAAILRPVLGSGRGVIISNGINFRYGFIDPYWMAASCIDEALRQIICVGGSLKEVALLDNFCWGNPDKPDRLGGLVRAALGCYDIAKGFGTPFISGKDSLYNEYTVGKKSLAIPGTLLISAIAVMEDVSKAISQYAKKPGDLLYAVGLTRDELGGSHYFDTLGKVGNQVPQVEPKSAKRIFEALSRASHEGLIQAMHDCSQGGLAVSAAEMAFSGGWGMELFLSEVPCHGFVKKSNDGVLFSESNSRFIVEVRKKDQKKFARLLKGIPCGLIGCVAQGREFMVRGLAGKVCVKADIGELKKAWQKPLAW